MARKFLTSLDLSNLEALNLKFQNLAADPGSGVGAGSAYFNTVLGKMKYHNGTAYYDPTDRATHSGTQLAATISNLATTVQAYRLDQFAVPTSDLNLNSRKITGLAPGTLGTDAVNLNQLDARANGTDWKDSVRAATTANITLSGLQTIDGISVTAGQRVLVKNQTTASENGIYAANSGAWTRTVDAGQGNLTAASAMMVEEGTTNASTQWRVTTTGTITVGTTSLAFGQIGAGTSYTGGTGISVAGNVISATGPQKYSTTIGTGAATSIVVTHSLNTKDVTYSLRQVADDAVVEADVVFTSTTTMTFTFAVAPASNALRVVVIG